MQIGDFEPHLNSQFKLSLPDGEMAMDLVEVTKRGQGAREGGAFAVLWEAPADPMLPQGIYTLSHSEMGELEIFVVPVAQFGDRIQYEAVYT